jgi:predicted RNA-binding Zn-ribbon protein involved in translation (DUF1610 family)
MEKIKEVKIWVKNWFVCPHCEEKQESIGRWETASVGYEYAFENKNWEIKDIEGGDFEDWFCPNCGGLLILPEGLLEQIY